MPPAPVVPPAPLVVLEVLPLDVDAVALTHLEEVHVRPVRQALFVAHGQFS
jgi:hypothetical protein